MKRMSVVTIVIVVMMGLVFSSCAIEPVQPIEAPEAQVAVEEVPDYAVNPELRYLERQPKALALETGDMPAVYLATGPNYVVGEYLCKQKDGQQVVRLEPDGTIARVLAPDDAVDIGYFWFSDGEFHVISDVDQAADESVFHVFIDVDESGVFLHFEPCGGNCVDTAGIEWLEGLARIESTGFSMN